MTALRRPAASALVLLGFDDITVAADTVPAILEHHPAALEGLDHRLVELEHSRRLAEKALRQLPAGNAWLMVQIDGDDQDDADHKAKQMIHALRRPYLAAAGGIVEYGRIGVGELVHWAR